MSLTEWMGLGHRSARTCPYSHSLTHPLHSFQLKLIGALVQKKHVLGKQFISCLRENSVIIMRFINYYRSSCSDLDDHTLCLASVAKSTNGL